MDHQKPEDNDDEEEFVTVPTWIVLSVCLGVFLFLTFAGSIATAGVLMGLKAVLPGFDLTYNFSFLGGLCFSTIFFYESMKRAFT